MNKKIKELIFEHYYIFVIIVLVIFLIFFAGDLSFNGMEAITTWIG